MKRRPHFIVAFLATAITFGSLMAFVGPQNSGWNRDRYGWHGGWRHHYYDNYDRDYRYEHNNPADTNRRH